MEQEFDVRAFIKCLIVVLVTCFIPYAASTTSPWLEFYPVPTFESLFASVTVFPSESRVSIIGHFGPGRLLIAFVTAALPIWFFYLHLTRSKTESLRNQGIAASVYLGLLSLFLTPSVLVGIFGDDMFPYVGFSNAWEFFPTLILFTMILLPIFDREVVHRYEGTYKQIPSNEYHSLLIQKKRIQKARLVGLATAVATIVLPASVSASFEIGELATHPPVVSFFSVTFFFMSQDDMINAIATPTWAVFFTLAFSVFNLVFARRLLRFYYGEGNRSAVLRAGVLGMAWATLLTVIPELFAGVSSSVIPLTLPNPILFVIGLIVMRYQDPAPDVPFAVLDEEPLLSTDTDVFEDDVKVPFVYLVYSHLRNRWRRARNHAEDESSLSS
ncbi:MAG: hypothetical protein ACW99U_12250 [Candidatus Thorarchaeota archaeon]